MNNHYSPDSGVLSEGSEDIEGISLPHRVDQDNISRATPAPQKWRRKPLFPSHDLPPRPGNSVSGIKSSHNMYPAVTSSSSPLYQRLL